MARRKALEILGKRPRPVIEEEFNAFKRRRTPSQKLRDAIENDQPAKSPAVSPEKLNGKRVVSQGSRGAARKASTNGNDAADHESDVEYRVEEDDDNVEEPASEVEDIYDVPVDPKPRGRPPKLPRPQSPAPESSAPDPVDVTPKRKRGRPPKSASATPSKPQATPVGSPSKARGQTRNPVTPAKSTGPDAVTPRRRQAADRSARRKSARALIERVIADDDGPSDDDQRQSLAQAIYEDDSDAESDASSVREDTDSAPATPSKTPGRKPTRARKQRSPTPPRDLPPHELYFAHNKPGRPRTSHNTLSSLDLLTHEEYFQLLRDQTDPHSREITFLVDLYAASFPQWRFELDQGFGLCLYGLGSKRDVLDRFLRYIHSAEKSSNSNKIVVINAYVPTITPRDILSTIWSAIDTSKAPSAQTDLMLSAIATRLSKPQTKNPITITLAINSIDSLPARKPALQSIFASLASIPQIRLACTAETPDFPLLWDVSQRTSLTLLFHDCTTLTRRPAAEIDVIDTVHELLGRATSRAGGKDGAAFVLKSLTQNARSLYALLLAEMLTVDEGEGENPSIEYRLLFNKAVEAFVCPSSEMAFRQLLREFHDHQMITSRKDALGTEILGVPFKREEMESLLEEIES